MKIQPIFLGVAVLLLLGCSEADSASTTEPIDPASSERCSPANDTTGDPKTIYELLDLINGLPRPVTLPCLLESLDRPLSLNSTFNTQSAQPALGKRSPRIFIILNESLSLSLVPGGEATLEFGARTADQPGVSVKGELHFPVGDELTPEDAFVRLAPAASSGLTLQQGTSCGTCHDNESPAPAYPFAGAFASAIVKPAPFFAVDAAVIQRERDTCDSAAEPERCAVLGAMFDHGDVVQTPFP